MDGQEIYHFDRGQKFKDLNGSLWHCIGRLVSPHSGNVLYHLSTRDGTKYDEDWFTKSEIDVRFSVVE